MKIGKYELNNKGLSLPLVIGLVSLLMIASVGINELILKALRSAHNIEASDKAYFAAEAGIEDALYELSEHFAGYETDSIRTSSFISSLPSNPEWKSEWEISNRSEASGGTVTFGTDTNTNLKLHENEKLIISLFDDAIPSAAVADNGINTDPAAITRINNPTQLLVTFRIPWDEELDYSDPYTSWGTPRLAIDNDGDAGTNGVNEDGEDDDGNCYGTGIMGDADCDGKDDEDSWEDPVIYWKILDDKGNILTPIKGCIVDTVGSEICEKDFVYTGGYLSFTLSSAHYGLDQDNVSKTIGDFIQNADVDAKLQLEFLVVAPLEESNSLGTVQNSIPYLEYIVEAQGGVDNLPLPYFTITSDGWYHDFKQSITTYVTPKAVVPLFDFTIIQQQ